MSKRFFLSSRVTSDILVPIIAVIFSLIVGGFFILAIGQNPIQVYRLLFEGTFGTISAINWYGIGQVLFNATPLIFTGLAVAFAFRAGLFNIGAEGQLYIGAFLTALAGTMAPYLPAILLIPLCIFAGIIGGGFWGFIPGVLKARLGVHEVINTIMLNFIAVAVVAFFGEYYFYLPETVHTAEIAPNAVLSRLLQWLPVFRGSLVNMSLFIAFLSALVVYIILTKTRFGYELRAVGLSPSAAEYAGINVPRITTIAMFISGGLAGLVGTNFVLGYKHFFEDGFSSGVGFMGIAVALLGRNQPIGIIAAGLLFGALSHGGLVINTIVPKELIEVLQGIIIISVVLSSQIFRRWLRQQKSIIPV
ncbi:MAG: ABC transporter permease [bacterium]|nr:ABC transporter permease [bacterium]